MILQILKIILNFVKSLFLFFKHISIYFWLYIIFYKFTNIKYNLKFKIIIKLEIIVNLINKFE